MITVAPQRWPKAPRASPPPQCSRLTTLPRGPSLLPRAPQRSRPPSPSPISPRMSKTLIIWRTSHAAIMLLGAVLTVLAGPVTSLLQTAP